jgi:AcrR family transcriptional regulator
MMKDAILTGEGLTGQGLTGDEGLSGEEGRPGSGDPAGQDVAGKDSAGKDLAGRIADRALAGRSAGYADEVRRLLDAALEVIRKGGKTARPRVADIVSAAGLSNDAFYRYFSSKDALIAALLEDGADRLASYAEHRMAGVTAPEDMVRRWVEAILSQTRAEIAAATLAVLWNGGGAGTGSRHSASAPLAQLLHLPFVELGSTTPEMTASLVAHATLGKVSEYLWTETSPGRAEVDQVVGFALAAVGVRIPTTTTGAGPAIPATR